MFLQDKSKQHKNVNAEKKQEGPEGRRIQVHVTRRAESADRP